MIYSVGVLIVFWGKLVIVNNDFIVFVLDGVILKFYNDVEFFNNKGFCGGVVVMYGYFKIVFMKNFLVLFKYNLCLYKGGVIYIEVFGFLYIIFNFLGMFFEGCFFVYED